MEKVYVVVNGHVPTTFKDVRASRRFAAQILRTYHELGLSMRTLRRGKYWKVEFSRASGIAVTLSENNVY